MDVPVEFDDSRLNDGRTIRLLTGPVLRTCVQYLVVICRRPKAASDVTFNNFVRPIVPEKLIKFGDHRLNRSRETPP